MLPVIDAFAYSYVPQNLFFELYNELIDSVTDVFIAMNQFYKTMSLTTQRNVSLVM